ncbi:hypothetical protein VCHA29O37_460017 [Vibrio chagasii]|nr:hypothetical protein VCHA29O37_460017 [Vibrio chagasii]
MLNFSKCLAGFLVIIAVAYFSYDYGIKTNEQAHTDAQNALLDKLEAKQDEAYQLSYELATREPIIETEYKEIEKQVIKYVQKNNDERCVSNDGVRVRLRAESIRAYNRAVNIHEPAAPINDPAVAP